MSDPRPIEVLVVDDSAVTRQLMTAICAKEPDLHVTTASDPLVAMARMRRTRPDVILLDLEMPRMDGLTFLKTVMADRSGAGGRLLRASPSRAPGRPCARWRRGRSTWRSSRGLVPDGTVEDGASAAGERPGGGPGPRAVAPRASAAPLAAVAVPPPPACTGPAAPTRSPSATALPGPPTTGWWRWAPPPAAPKRCGTCWARCRPTAPGIVVVQHMPEGFTAAFAQRLNEICAIEVREARHGDRVQPGLALIAPGNRHMRLRRRRGATCWSSCDDGPGSAATAPASTCCSTAWPQPRAPGRRASS